MSSVSRIDTIGVVLTSSPRLGRGLVTSLLADGVRLALVLGHAGVNLLDDIRADRAQEHSRDGVGVAGGSAIGADDGDGRTGGHCIEIKVGIYESVEG